MNRVKCLLLLLALWASTATATEITLDPTGKPVQGTISLPYGFYNEKFGFAVGYVYGRIGYPQQQSSMITTVMAGTEGSAMGFLIGQDFRLPGTERWFVDPIASVGYFGDSEVYVNGNPDYPNERAGGNDSHKDNFIDGEGWDNFFRIKFKYVLPIGDGADNPVSVREGLDRGLPPADASYPVSWNPLRTGKTYLEIRPFYRSLEVKGDDFQDTEIKTNGLGVGAYWDNRDFRANPSRGHSARFTLSRDFGQLDSSESWTSLSFELDKYIDLGRSDWFRQRVLALDFWTAYSPTWEENPDGSVKHGAPPFAGATLGGLWRLRGYPSQRFSDKAGIYYAAELRLIPNLNPFENWQWLQDKLDVSWVQIVPFVERGRVAPKWNIGDLHEDTKWSAGIGLRARAKGLVVRIDTAASEEDVGIQMMINQPFQF